MDVTRAVMVGCGGISRAWLEAVTRMEQVQLVGLVDLVRESAEQRAAQYGLGAARIGVDLEEMLAAVQPDVVFNCTIPDAHLPVTLTALAHGCHVLGEKPLADSMAAARQMVRAAADAGTHPGRHPEPALCRAHPPAASRAPDRRHRPADHGELRFLPRRALWRLSRPHGARAAARYGHPLLRSGALYHRRRSGLGLLPRVESRGLLVRP